MHTQTLSFLRCLSGPQKTAELCCSGICAARLPGVMSLVFPVCLSVSCLNSLLSACAHSLHTIWTYGSAFHHISCCLFGFSYLVFALLVLLRSVEQKWFLKGNMHICTRMQFSAHLDLHNNNKNYHSYLAQVGRVCFISSHLAFSVQQVF